MFPALPTAATVFPTHQTQAIAAAGPPAATAAGLDRPPLAGTSPYRNEQALVVFPGFKLKRSTGAPTTDCKDGICVLNKCPNKCPKSGTNRKLLV